MLNPLCFQFESNALFAQEWLTRKGINAELKSKYVEDVLFHCLSVATEDLDRAKKEIAALHLDESELSENSERYIDNHREWIKNMHSPGHYTGGNTPHYLLDKRNFVVFGVLLFGWGVITLLPVFNSTHWDYSDFFHPALNFLIAISLFYQARKKEINCKNQTRFPLPKATTTLPIYTAKLQHPNTPTLLNLNTPTPSRTPKLQHSQTSTPQHPFTL